MQQRPTSVHRPSHALVLAGGGVTGIAWEIGMLAGLWDAGIDLTSADLIVGTSAGAAVAAQIASGVPMSELLAKQQAVDTSELSIDFDLESYRAATAALLETATDVVDACIRRGRMAVEADVVPEPVRRAVIAARLPVHTWPDRKLVITAVDVVLGTLVVFDRDSGVPLVDAVAASCAVPGIWPPVTVGPHRYMDGVCRSSTNADLAAGYDRVVVLIPIGHTEFQKAQLRDELSTLGADAVSHVVYANADSLGAIGSNPLDASRRPAAAHAGQMQAKSVADDLVRVWA